MKDILACFDFETLMFQSDENVPSNFFNEEYNFSDDDDDVSKRLYILSL